jgi:hypothetical protein
MVAVVAVITMVGCAEEFEKQKKWRQWKGSEVARMKKEGKTTSFYVF